MRISVVMVCLNSEVTIRAAIESFYLQRYEDSELVVIDGGSSDRTIEYVKSLSSSRLRLISEPDDGLFDAMNKGLKLFAGDAIGFLNSDDTFHDATALEQIGAGLADADILYGDIDLVADHQTKRVVRAWRSGRFRKPSLSWGWMPPHQAFYVRRAVAEEVGEFDPSLRVGADYELMMRALLKGYRINYISEVLVDFAMGGTSNRSIRSRLQGNIDCLRARQRHLGAGFIDWGFFAKPASKLSQIRFSI